MMLTNQYLPYIVGQAREPELRHHDKNSYQDTQKEYAFLFMTPEGDCVKGNGVISWNTDGHLEKFTHKYELRLIKTFFKDDFFSECVLAEFISDDRLGKTIIDDGTHTVEIPIFVGSNEELPIGYTILLSFEPEVYDNFERRRILDTVEERLNGDPCEITVSWGDEPNKHAKTYDAVYVDGRFNENDLEELSKIKNVHVYHTRHDDNGDWTTPITIRKEGHGIAVNHCGMIITVDEIKFPPFSEFDEVDCDVNFLAGRRS